jgi:oxygen-independent coproporphyrinogen-3 oxidase
MRHFETTWERQDSQFPELPDCLLRLAEMEADGLVELSENKLVVPEHARPFVRNICMAFDLRLLRDAPDARIFR